MTSPNSVLPFAGFTIHFEYYVPCYRGIALHPSLTRQILSRCLLMILLTWFCSALADNSRLIIGEFSAGSLDGWEPKSFKGYTLYTIDLLGDSRVLRAESDKTASGLFKKQRIDLEQTPYLNWSWRVENRLGAIDEQSKAGDDYAARVYVVVSGGWAFWRTRAINYVWAGNSPKDKIWPNAFAGNNAMMIALRSSKDRTTVWYQEKRNILRDLEQQFGERIRYIDAVALMTDTDNSQGKAVAYYGDIYFTRD